MPIPEWRIKTFGGLRVDRGDTTITRFRTGKTGELLGCLACQPRRSHRRVELAERLWPDAEPALGLGRLRTAIASLRRQFGDSNSERFLRISATEISLDPATVTTDVAEFESLLREARKATGIFATKCLSEAVGLYTGSLLTGYEADWIDRNRSRLSALYAEASLDLITVLETRGETREALWHALNLVRLDPASEESHVALMRIYAATGQRSAALRQYRSLRRARNLDKTGLPLSQAVLDLARRLRQGEALVPPSIGIPATSPIAAVLPSVPRTEPTPWPAQVAIRRHRYPVPLTGFFGRESEIARVTTLFRGSWRRDRDGARLVTLTGPAGIGKSRLALELARRQEQEIVEIRFVPLSGAGTVQEMISALLQAVSEDTLPAGADPIEHLVSEAGCRAPMRLILDNFEQLLPSGDVASGEAPSQPPDRTCAEIIETLLNSVPSLTILVTSRRRLGLDEEQIVLLNPLPIPSKEWDVDRIRESPGVRLFVDRARARQVDFAVTQRNAPFVAEICACLEGLPLAIELASAQVGQIPVSEISGHLRDRLGFLTIPAGRGQNDSSPALRAAFDWSYRLLSQAQRRLFAQLSVFRGWETAQVIDLLDESAVAGVAMLCDHSLVLREPDDDNRFRMLESIREFAGEKLTTEDRKSLLQEHAALFLRHARSAIQASLGPDQAAGLRRMDYDLENVRCALRASLGTEVALQMTAALHQYWYVRGLLGEGISWMRDALDACESAPDGLRASNLNALGTFSWSCGDLAAAERALSEALRLKERSDDKQAMAALNNNIGNLELSRGNIAVARQRLSASIELHRVIGREDLAAHALANLATAEIEAGEFEKAAFALDESLKISQNGRDELCIANGRQQQGVLAFLRGDTVLAAQCFIETLTRRSLLQDHRYLPGLLVWTGALFANAGDLSRASRLLAGADMFRRKAGTAWTTGEQQAMNDASRMVAAGLENTMRSLTEEEGCDFSFDQVIAHALRGFPQGDPASFPEEDT